MDFFYFRIALIIIKILEAKFQGFSNIKNASKYEISKHSVQDVAIIAENKRLVPEGTISDLTDEEL